MFCSQSRAGLVFSGFVVALALSGCSNSLQQAGQAKGTTLSGMIHGGQQPVSGATIQLYAVSSTSTGGAAASEISATVTSSDGTGSMNSNANAGNGNNTFPAGAFTITGDYTCPAADAQVYIVASGGNPGLSAGTNNTALRLMAAIGSCGQLSSSTQLEINEVTTVGSVAALYPYMTAYNAIGSTSGNTLALFASFGLTSEYMNVATGLAPGATLPSGYYASSTELNTLANVVAACINSPGDTGASSICDMLFTAATPPSGTAPTDTVGALIDILKNPTNNVSTIYSLSPSSPPFQPTLSSAPSDWTLPILAIPATPRFSPAAGTYAAGQSVSVASPTASVSVYYTTDGSTPTKSSSLYTGPITVSANQTLSAIAVNRVSSSMGSATYSITGAPAAPTFSLASGTYSGPQVVSLASTTPDAVIHYTTNGSTPTTASAVYSGPLQVSNTSTLNAIATSGSTASAVSSASYTLTKTSGTIYTYAGGGNVIEGVSATSLGTTNPSGVVADANGNVYFSDGTGHRVRKITAATGLVSTVAGTGTSGYSASQDGGLATSAQVNNPHGLALDAAGNLYIADTNNHRIRMVSATTGLISTVAGTGTSGYSASQDGGPATSAQLNYPSDVALDASANLYIGDTNNNRVRKVNSSTGVITTIGGTGTSTYNGDDIAATTANLNAPRGIAVDASGNVYIAESSANRIRFISAVSGLIYTIAGTGTYGYNASQDGGPATSAQIYTPYKVALDALGNLYIADTNNYRIRKVNIATGTISTIAGTGSSGYTGDGGSATGAKIGTAYGVWVDLSGNVYITDATTYRIREISASTSYISTIAGNGITLGSQIANNVPATQTALTGPFGVVFDSSNNLYLTNYSTSRVREVVASSGMITTLAGTGTTGYSGDTGQAVNAQINAPTGVALDSSGNLYFSDATNHVVREIVASTGVINTIAGNGASGYSGDGGAATSAQLTLPQGLAFDASGNLYIADYSNHRIRMVNTSGVISTVVGTGTGGYVASQDGGAATSAEINEPEGLAFDKNGNLYIADYGNSRIRKVSGGVITTVAGTGTAGYLASQDGGAATSAELNFPYGVAVDGSGNVYIADTFNNLVRKITVSTGIITSVAGSNSSGFTGDGGPATSAKINAPRGVALDSNGNLYISDYGNSRIRVVYP